MTEKLKNIKLVAMDVDGTFTDGTLYYDSDGNVIKAFSSQDGMGLELLRRAGIKRGFITGRHDNATEARLTYLGVDFFVSSVGDKAYALKKVLAGYNIDASECLFVGDDLNDLTGFEVAGITVAVANAVDELKKQADIITDSAGGEGAVREVANMILKAKNINPAELWLSDRNRTVGKQ